MRVISEPTIQPNVITCPRCKAVIQYYDWEVRNNIPHYGDAFHKIFPDKDIYCPVCQERIPIDPPTREQVLEYWKNVDEAEAEEKLRAKSVAEKQTEEEPQKAGCILGVVVFILGVVFLIVKLILGG